MVLVTGGIASGKRSYVAAQGYEPEHLNPDPHSDAPVLTHLEELLREGPLSEDDVALVAAKDYVICCEVGQGVVPMDASERAWRELVGRTCAQLAAQATQVVRMVCGIPVVIKG